MESETLRVIPTILVSSVLILLYCYFVLAGIALRRARESRVRELHEDGTLFAGSALKLLEHLDRHLSNSRLGAFLASMAVGWYVLAVTRERILHTFEPVLSGESPIVGMSAKGLFAIALLGLVTFVAFVLLRIGRSLIHSHPERALCGFALPVFVVSKIFHPFTLFLERTQRILLKVFNLKNPVERDPAASAEEISEIVNFSLEAGEIEEDEREMIQGVFAFSDTEVDKVMTPRSDIVSIEDTTSLEEIVAIFREEGFSRLLVTGGELDEVHGFLLAKDLLRFVGKDCGDFRLKELLRMPYFVSSGMRIDDLLKELSQRGIHMAVVLDEHGGVDGIATVEDLLEELVGEIFDEYDSPAEEIEIVETLEGDLLVDGGVLIDDLNSDYGFVFPEGEYNTVAGFVFHLLGRIPREGERVSFQNIEIRVEKLDQNRIVTLRILRSGCKSGQLDSGKSETFRGSFESNDWERKSGKKAGVSS